MTMRTYVDWLQRHTLAISAVSAIVVAISAFLAITHLPLRADLSYLLPQDVQAVKDLRKLEARVDAQDTVLVVVISENPVVRAEVANQLATAIARLPDTLVKRVETDDVRAREYLRAHRHLFVPYNDLVTARDALAEKIRLAKLAANPLFVELDDPPLAAPDRLAELREKARDAEAVLDRSGFLSTDEHTQLIVVRTSFSRSAVARGEQLIAAIGALKKPLVAQHPDVQVGVAAGVVSAVAEQHALVRGMLLSSLVTAVLVALVLAWFFRSVRALVLLLVTLVVGTGASFGVAALTVGHLNVATAFLGAIIAGNGVNYGILLIAGYQEEGDLAAAMASTLRPTLIASLGAAIAYASLAATSFRGFADFAVIGGVGMLLCWLASYTLLPALLARWPVAIATRRSRLLPARHAGIVCFGVLAVAIAASILSYRFIAGDPFEYNLNNLRSHGDEARVARHWVQLADKTFGRGISGQTIIAVDRLEQVPRVVGALRAVDPEHRTVGTIRSLLDVVPERQPDKLRVLAEIRTLLDDPALQALGQRDRDELLAWRPPNDLAAITLGELPDEIAARLRERDGRVGYLIGVRPSPLLDEWDGRALIRFASAIRRVDLGHGESITTSGSHVIYADIIATLNGDGPRVVAVAVALLVVMVLLLAGGMRKAIAVLLAISIGALCLIAVCSLIGLKVTFLDFVALPITLGLGVDYAINMAHRPSSGAAVFVCSLTTIIGYGSLLISDNRAIQGFGLAALARLRAR